MRTMFSIFLAFIVTFVVSVSPAWPWSAGSTGICSDHSGRNFPCSSGTQDDDWERYTNDDYEEYYEPTPLSRAIDLYNEGNKYLRAGRYYEAESLYRQALALYSRKSYIHNNLGAALFYQGRLEEAVEEFVIAGNLGDRTAAKYAKTLRKYLQDRDIQDEIERLWDRNKQLYSGENFSAAAATMREVITLMKRQGEYTDRDRTSAQFQLWRALYSMCREHDFKSKAKSDCLRPALDAITQGYRLMPESASNAEAISLTLYFMDRHEESAMMLLQSWKKGADKEKIITIFKDHISTAYPIDTLHYLRGLRKMAADDSETREWMGKVIPNIVNYAHTEDRVILARELVELFPDRASSHILLGSKLMENGDLRQGRKSFAKAIKLEPENYYPRSQLGYSLYQAKEYGEAVAAYREAIHLSGGNVPDTTRDDLYYFLARNLEGMGDVVGAEDAFVEAIEMDSADSWNHLLYGEFLERQGRYVAAERAMKKAIYAGSEPEAMKNRYDQFLERQGRAALEAQQFEAAELYLSKAVDLGKEEIVDALASARTQAAAEVSTARQSRAKSVNSVAERLRITPFTWTGKQPGMQEREVREQGGKDTSAERQGKSAKGAGQRAIEAFSSEAAADRGQLTFDTQGAAAGRLSTSSVVLGKAPSSTAPPLPEITEAQRKDTFIRSFMSRHDLLIKELAKQQAKTAKAKAELDAPPSKKPAGKEDAQASKSKAEKQVELVKEREKEDRLKSKLQYIRLSVLERLKQLKEKRSKEGSNDKK